jgi:uncharacterized protein (TIGR02646 family)
MRKISKGIEPTSLTEWKQANSNKKYCDLEPKIRQDIRKDALEEQFYICAYCCQGIENIHDCHNEHLEAQSVNLKRTVDFTNIVASCNIQNQCGDAHKSQFLPLTPLMPECETEIRFKISGRVEGLSDRAKTTIEVLNLGDHEKHNKKLIEKRKQFSDTLLWKNGIDPNQGLEDDQLLEMVIEDLVQPKQGQMMEPFTPVVINILRSWLSQTKKI